MRSRSSLRLTLPILFLFAATVFSSAAVKNRITSVNSTARVAIPHTVSARARAAADLGEASSSRQLGSLMLTFNMTDAQQAALTQLLIDLQDPASPSYHQWLTPEQFGEQFGLSAADLSLVSSWLSSQGFTITDVGRASNYITFSGTAGQVQRAFGTTIHSLNVGGESHISNLSDPVLPAGIAAVVTNISGLNDFKLKPRIHARTVRPDFTSSLTGTHYIAPGDFYTIYNVSPLIAASITGQGVTIAIMGQTDINTADVTAFRTASGLCTAVSSTCPNPLPTIKLYGTDPGTSSGDLGEALLDVEWAGAVAPNANILYVNSTNVISGSLVNAINNNVAPIISISYGDCEANFGASTITQYNQFFQQANTQGQTIVGPTGDSGATDCDFVNYPAVGGLGIDFPAASPFVTAAGGSMFNEGTGTFWSSNSSSTTNNAGSALSYIPETVWNESSSSNGLGAGGGGTSIFSSKPYWQVGLTPADSSRDTPDISLSAASNHDGTLYCGSGTCTNGTFRDSSQNLTVVGGTSVATPSFAGILALIEQKTGSRIGNTGPQLYALASNSTIYTNAFHDIKSGNNNSPCTPGTPNCPAGGSVGFSAGAGYDLATGWGSINAYNLVNSWNQVPPIGPGTIIGQKISTTTLTTTSPLCGVTGNTPTLSLSARVASSVTGNTPTGTITILVDNVPTTTSATLAAGAVAISFSTAGISSGFHTISAIYSGDSVNASSKTSITADIVSSTASDFAFTAGALNSTNACTPAVSAVSGGTASAITFTVTPQNGFTGAVTFTATSLDSVDATFTFTPISVTTSGTTSFVLNAFATTSQSVTGSGRLKAAKQQTPRAPWYLPASGATLACALLFILPRRRRWTALLPVVLSAIVLSSAIGCGSSRSSSGGGGGGGGGSTIINAAPSGNTPYNILVTATATTSSGFVAHSVNVAFTVK